MLIGFIVLNNSTTRREMTSQSVEIVPLTNMELLNINREDRIEPAYAIRVGERELVVSESAYRALEAEATTALYVAKHTQTVVAAE